MSQSCLQDDRRDAVRRRAGWNGLDYVELAADGVTLRAFFLGKLPPELVPTAENDPTAHLRVEGGDRITGLRIVDVQAMADEDAEHDDQLLVRLDRVGDFSPYTLRLVDIVDLDPLYDSASFRFRVDCPSDLDCAPRCDCPPETFDEPELDYLAKDYDGFMRLLADRMALLVPGWTERHAPDIGNALVELLAYTGDYLSYYQDAVATEAYLDTARRRISVRRHLRLIGYRLHEGCNARTYVAFEVDGDVALLAARVSLITDPGDALAGQRTVLGWEDLRAVPDGGYDVFEPLLAPDVDTISLTAARSEIRFHTFGRSSCCLEKGSTSAALLGAELGLQVGDVLILEEAKGPTSGLSADADPSRRQAVRLTAVEARQDPIVRTGDDQPTDYLWVEWGAEDALPFPLCLSAIGPAPGCAFIIDVSVARGNVVLVDHGRTLPPEDLGQVSTLTSQADCDCVGLPGELTTTAGPYRPSLAASPLTWRAPPADGVASAAAGLNQDPREAAAQVALASTPALAWAPASDLLQSGPSDAGFVVEIDNDGAAWLRFGDGELGVSAAAGMSFSATARVGNGVAGNVGAEAISRLVLRDETLDGVAIIVRNPLPAVGGTEPESVTQARLLAPYQLASQLERAVTADDYAVLAGRDPRLQRAAAQLVWTGSWYEADVAVDPLGTETAGPDLLAAVDAELEPYRRIGHDLSVRPAIYVPVDLQIDVCLAAGYRRADVAGALEQVFGTGVLTEGKPGFFNPDGLSFGDGVFVSRVVAAAQAVPGVAQAWVSRLNRRLEPADHEIEDGVLALKPWEVARLDDDPDHSERGRLVINVREGC